MSAQGENDKPAAPAGGWMKVSRPHKALPQVPPQKDQSTTTTTTTPPNESPPQSISSVPSTEATPVGSPSTVSNIPPPPAAKWRAVKVQAADQAATRGTLVTSNDSNSSANGSEPTTTPEPIKDDKRITVIIIFKLFEDFDSKFFGKSKIPLCVSPINQ